MVVWFGGRPPRHWCFKLLSCQSFYFIYDKRLFLLHAQPNIKSIKRHFSLKGSNYIYWRSFSDSKKSAKNVQYINPSYHFIKPCLLYVCELYPQTCVLYLRFSYVLHNFHIFLHKCHCTLSCPLEDYTSKFEYLLTLKSLPIQAFSDLKACCTVVKGG